MRKTRNVLMLLVVLSVLVFVACGQDVTPDPVTPQDTTTAVNETPNQNGDTQDTPVTATGTGGHGRLSPDNPVTINVFIASSQMAPNPDNKLSALLLSELGVTINYDIVTPDQQDTRIALMLAAGEIPELVGATDADARLVQGGALLRLDPFLDSGQWPTLANHIAPYRERLSWTGGGVEDGLYQFPNYNRFYGNPPIMGPIHWSTAFWLQKSVLEWHGFPSLEDMTLERYFDLIEAYMQEFPEIDGMPTIGFTFPVSGRVWGLTNPPLFLAGHPNNGGVMVIDGQAHIYANTQYAEDYFRFLNYAHSRGLLDPESFTQTLDQYFAKLATGRVLGMHDQRWGFGVAYDSLVEQGRYERTWVGTMPTFPGRTPWYADRDVMNINQGFGIAVNAADPELLLDFLETMMSQEWQIRLSWGIMDEDFHVDDNGYFYRTPQQVANSQQELWRLSNRLEALLDQMPKWQGTLICGNAFGPGDQPAEFIRALSDYNRMFLESYNKSTWRQFLNDPPPNPSYFPAWQISPPDGSAAQVAGQQLEDVALQFLPHIIMADPANFDTMWAEYLAAIDMIDVAAFEASITEGIQERIALFGN